MKISIDKIFTFFLFKNLVVIKKNSNFATAFEKRMCFSKVSIKYDFENLKCWPLGSTE